MIPVAPSILSLIPEGCHVNWNKKAQKFYVFKSEYIYCPDKKGSKEIRTQVGTVVNGKFTFAKSYLLKQKVLELEKRIASETVPKSNGPARSVVKGIPETTSDNRQQAKVVYPLAYANQSGKISVFLSKVSFTIAVPGRP